MLLPPLLSSTSLIICELLYFEEKNWIAGILRMEKQV